MRCWSDTARSRRRALPRSPAADGGGAAQGSRRGGGAAVLEFLYDREIREGRLQAANFLGLAEVKLQRNDTAAAIALLNRMALVVEDGFDTLLPAGELLGKYGKTAEAADFIRRRVKAVPWDSEAKVQLARTVGPEDAGRAPCSMPR